MRVGWSAEARIHLREIQHHIALENPGAALSVVAAIRGCIEHLRAHPMLGRAAEGSMVRVVTVPRTPYRIYYSRSGDRLWILAVWHGARQWPSAG